MKTFKFIGFALFAIILCLSACSSGGDELIESNPNPEVVKSEIIIDSNIITNGLSFSNEKGEQSISFSTNENWTLSVASTTSGTTWCAASVTSGSKGNANVKFTVTENTAYDNRSVSVTIKSGTASKTFTITQKSADALLVTTDKYEVNQEGCTIEIEVKSNIDYEIEISNSAKNWITESTGRGLLSTHRHIFKISANGGLDKREGKIHFRSKDNEEIVKVYQAGGKIIILSQNEYIVNENGETITVDIKSNVQYEVQMPDVDWIIADLSTRSMSSHTLKYLIKNNNTNKSRSAQIIFYDKNSSLKEVLKITQKNKELYVLKMNKAGTLKEELGDKINTINSIKIIGDLNGDDIYYLRQMAGYKYNAQAPVGTLNDMDLSEASIVSGGDYYFSAYSKKLYTENNKIGGSMFAECDSLCYVELPNNIISIGSGAFSGCKYLSEIIIPNSVVRIGSNAFRECEKLSNIKLPNNLTVLEDAFFLSGICEITIPEGITEIYDNTFYYCYNLKNITIPNSVSKIGYRAFQDCTSLISVDLSQVTYVREKAFEGCSNLEKIQMLNIKTIDKYAFSECEKLRFIYLGENTTSLGTGAFEDVTNDVTVFCYAKEPPKGCPFHKFMSSSCLYVPSRCGVLYANSVWGDYFYNKIIEMD